ncbi:hypothetical protein LTR37_019582 [Vermiconidia calcicola]|uniref:Uncharacterized protein n=1 Tax=Vermiconidia calcicola TaxID=1690605 RepID=A0ACC3MDP3_9PEZI|nr:hypothetical protein LTR37_019582 [Vermiconidia calcicola]
MAKTSQFKAYDLQRKKLHTISSPPVKLKQSRLERGEWTAASKAAAAATKRPSKVTKKRGRFSKKAATKKPPQRAADLLRCVASEEIECLHCNKPGDDQTCGASCYREFKKQHFIGNQIDIRGPGPMGYGAFTKPGVSIKKGQYLDEYVGDLRPLESNESSSSLYCFVIPQTCVVDAEKAGNWTRFVNSSCKPNVKPWADFVGKRHVIVFQALKDIGPEEEVVFDYGKAYFEKAGFECACDAHDRPHMPGQKEPKAKKAGSRR